MINITNENLPRFAKRLQKELTLEFKREISLNIAQELFAKSLGGKNLFELQKFLTNHIKPENKAQHFVDEIESYFKNNETLIGEIKIVAAKELMIYIGRVGFFLANNPNHTTSNTIDKSYNLVKVSEKEKTILGNIYSKYLSDDTDKNRIFGLEIKKCLLLEDNESYLIFRNKTCKDEEFFPYPNIRNDKQKFYIVPEDFFEKNKVMFASNLNKWAIMENLPDNYYDGFIDAMNNIKNNEMVLQVFKSGEKLYCSFYTYQKQKQKYLKSVSGRTVLEYRYMSDFIKFNGYLSRQEFQSKSTDNPYCKNEEKYKYWNEGYTMGSPSKVINNK